VARTSDTHGGIPANLWTFKGLSLCSEQFPSTLLGKKDKRSTATFTVCRFDESYKYIYFLPHNRSLALCVSAGTTTRTRFSAARNRQSGEWEPMYQTLVSVGSLSFGTFASVTKFGSCKGVWESTEKARAASPQFLLIQYHNSLARGVGHARTGNLPLNCYRCCAEEERGLTRQEGPLGPMF